MAKINDVAGSAGVSIATVSRVLSNAAVVAPATRRKVLAAVERLGYAPNATAKNLRMLRTRRLLVTVPDISRPLFSLILQGIEERANGEGYAVLLGDTQYDQGREERYAQMLQAKEADGLIFLGHPGAEYLSPRHPLAVPAARLIVSSSVQRRRVTA